MSCRQFIPDVIDRARGLALDPARLDALGSHLRSCTSCAALAERQSAVSSALRRLAHEQTLATSSEHALRKLLASLDAPRPRRRGMSVGVGLSLAASVLIVVGLSVGWKKEPTSRLAALTPPSAPGDETFVAIAGASALPQFERGEVIRVEIPSAGGAIQADVLVGQDGLARAVRLVQ
jgi:anti-sigma factor RsiW